MNFNRYLNYHRIQHCLTLLDSGAHNKKSLEGIARDCGFNNRNTFTQSFRQVCKTTPSDYIRENLPD
jgi:transcriptional regulator GlxA family with amidase domain